jgi:hypothetical protein
MQNLYNKNVFRKALKGDHAIAVYPKATNGAQTVAAADASNDRKVLIVVEVTEVFADGDGGQPTFKVGETSTTDKFSVTSLLSAAALGQKFLLAGTLSATKALLVTAVAATGTGTGAIKVSAAILPATITQF